MADDKALDAVINQITKDSAQLIGQREAIETFFQNWQTLEKSRQKTEKITQNIESEYPLLNRDEAVKFIMDLEFLRFRCCMIL